MEKKLATCTPADLLVCMESQWLPNHAGTMLPDGSMIASPSGVSGCLSHLSTDFLLIGKVGEWDPLTSTGNPVVSTDLAQYRTGYRMQAWRSGYLEGSAMPINSCANQQGLPAGSLPGPWRAEQHSWASTAAGREGHHATAANVGNTSQG